MSMFLLTFFFVPMSQLNGFLLMPGDIGDARLNNYFLENIFKFFTGHVDSLWQMSFFNPFPYVIGFSDNHFGSAPVYLIVRVFGIEPDTSFQIWFLCGYLFNFAGAYFALRYLKGSVIASTIGALIFTFALPVSAHANHAQLHYRFALPLAITFFAIFLDSKQWRNLLIAHAWLVWQFYCGVYIGFFTLLLMFTMSIAYILYILIGRNSSIKEEIKSFIVNWKKLEINKKLIILSGLLSLSILLLILFYPYIRVSNLYGIKRSWEEIAVMLPRPQSYLLSDFSLLWSNRYGSLFDGLPLRHEHQMFIGLVPLLLALIGLFLGIRSTNVNIFIPMLGMLVICVLLTLYLGGASLWYLLHKLPLASAIRAMSRIDQAFLFPIAYLAVVAVDELRKRNKWYLNTIVFFVFPLFILEAGLSSMGTSTKDSWRQRYSEIEKSVPKNVSHDSVLFFAQQSGPPYAVELDAMWVSIMRGSKTMNGYSGFLPPNYRYEYGTDCTELPRRVLAFMKFTNQSDNLDLYRALLARVVPINFVNCDPAWFENPPQK